MPPMKKLFMLTRKLQITTRINSHEMTGTFLVEMQYDFQDDEILEIGFLR